MSKWITFIDWTACPQSKRGRRQWHKYPKTKTILIRTREEVPTTLGYIKWYGPFRKYSFMPEPNMVFEATCIQDILDKIKELTEERKLERAKETAS